MVARQKPVKHAPINPYNVDSNYMAIIEELIVTIGRETDKKKVLGIVLPYALAISGVEAGTLLVASDEPNNLNAVAKRGMPDEVIQQLTRGELGRLLLMGQRLWIRPQPLRLDTEQALLGRHKLKYIFGVPLRFEGQVLGAIVVGSRATTYETLRPEQQQHLALLAQLVALFLDDIRLRTYRQGQAQAGISPRSVAQPNANTAPVDEMEHLLAAIMSAEEEVANQNTDLGMLNSLANEMGGTLQLDAVLNKALEWTQNALNAETSWCYLLQDGALALRGHRGLSDRYVAAMRYLQPGNGVDGMAFSHDEPVLRDGLLFHSGKARKVVKEEGLRIVAAVPLRDKDNTFGVLAAANCRDREWSSRDERMLVSVGQKIAQAISNSQMFSEATEKAETLENNYRALQQTNAQLEQQVQKLRKAEQQIWTALAASQQARRRSGRNASDPYADEQLITTLQRVLNTMDEDEDRPLLHSNKS